MCNITHNLSVIGKDVMRLSFTKCAMMSLTSCRSLEKMWRDCLSQNVQYHSLPVGHRKRCDETAFHTMCHVTHLLLVIGTDVMRLPFTGCAMSLTNCWSWEKMWWDCLAQNVQCHSLAVIHSQKCDETAFYKCATCHSHAVSHRKRCDETALPKMCNATHLLLFIAKDMMRLTFTNVQCHSHTVNHKKRCDETAFHKMMSLTPCWRCDETGFYKMSNVTHSLLVMENMWWDCLPQKSSNVLTSCQ